MKYLPCALWLAIMVVPCWGSSGDQMGSEKTTLTAKKSSIKVVTTAEEFERNKRPVTPTPVPVTTKPGFKVKDLIALYGFIRLDLIWDQHSTDNGNYARSIASKPNGEHRFSVTARQTQLGLNFPQVDQGWVGGKVEADFYNVSDENKNAIMMRQAYVEFGHAEKDWALLAGQTADVISPLNPSVLNYTVCYWVGNIGYRRPMVRFHWGTGRTNSHRSLLQIALARNIGSSATWITHETSSATVTITTSGMPTVSTLTTSNAITTTVSPIAEMPVAEGRFAQSFVIYKNNPSVIGVWGHWAVLRYDWSPTHAIQAYSSSVGGDLELNLTPKTSFKSEGWWGRNLGAYMGGIGQDYNATLDRGVRARGGWSTLSFGPCGRLRLGAGAGFDKPCHEDLNAGDKKNNYAYWTNVVVQLDSSSRFGVEISRWKTEYVNAPAGDSFRVQTSFGYDF